MIARIQMLSSPVSYYKMLELTNGQCTINFHLNSGYPVFCPSAPQNAYSNHPNTGHPKIRFIWIPTLLGVRYSNGGHYIYEQTPQAWVWAHHISTLVRLLPDHCVLYCECRDGVGVAPLRVILPKYCDLNIWKRDIFTIKQIFLVRFLDYHSKTGPCNSRAHLNHLNFGHVWFLNEYLLCIIFRWHMSPYFRSKSCFRFWSFFSFIEIRCWGWPPFKSRQRWRHTTRGPTCSCRTRERASKKLCSTEIGT